MRLTLVIPALGAGGAERVMATLANAWAGRGEEVTLLTYDDGQEAPFYPLDPAVHHRSLGIAASSATPWQSVRNNLRRLRVLRRTIAADDPDAIVSFLDQTNVVVLGASLGLGVPVIAAEHIDPAQQPLGRSWRALRRVVYPRAVAIVVLTETARAYFPRAIRRRTHVIPNPVVLDRGGPAAAPGDAPGPGERSGTGSTLIAAGRLTEQKGFDLLLQAFAAVAPRHPGWSLVVWGDGPLRPELERQRDDLGLRQRAFFPGLTDRLHHEMAAAELFVLSSRYEGFPMVLCEAMASGLPAVAFDCPSGPSAIVRDGVDGLLVPPEAVEALSAAMARLMADDGERRALGAQAPAVLDRFGLDRVLARWDDLFGRIAR